MWSPERILPIALLALCTGLASAQTDVKRLIPVLEQQIQAPEVTAFELRNYMSRKAPKLPSVSSAGEWRKQAAQLRQRILSEIVYHGWPRAWVEAPVKMEDLGLVPTGKGYRIRKLRYEIVPGFYASALLYEPEVIKGRMPAVLNANGHDKEGGKAIESKQKRCINQALNGMIALSPEWIYFGELRSPENEHMWSAALDLVGSNGVGLFYLATRRAFDYLAQHPNVDPERIAVTGVSGGGWQSILLAALDERVAVTIPVAGFNSYLSRLERFKGIGDNEQSPTDLYTIADYPALTAMCAPRPALLIYNSEDIAFPASLLKSYVYDEVRPFFRLFGAEDRFGWHLNTDPGDHNYQLDNREQAYRFLTKHFGLPIQEREIPVGDKLNTEEELTAGLPKNNLTMLGLARKLAGRIERLPIPSGADRAQWVERQRPKLRELVRLHPVAVEWMWGVADTFSRGVDARAYRLVFSNGLSARGQLFKAVSASDTAPATIILNDKGRKASAGQVAARVNRGEQVLALDVLAEGDGLPKPQGFRPQEFLQLAVSAGDRPLGMEAAQLAGAAQCLRQKMQASRVRVEASGIRSQMVALVAAALDPSLFSELVVKDGMTSLQHLLDAPITPDQAPDLFCLDLFKEFDVNHLVVMAAPVPVKQTFLQSESK